MITEDYVSFKTAKLLKEKGFDIPTERFYNEHISWRAASASNWNDEGGEDCSCPTLQMAMKWLREVHNIFIAINMIPDTIQKHYFFKLYLGGKIYNFPLEYSVKFYTIYEEAAEAAIKYCLENKLIF